MKKYPEYEGKKVMVVLQEDSLDSNEEDNSYHTRVAGFESYIMIVDEDEVKT